MRILEPKARADVSTDCEVFYRRLWEAGRWGTAEPNDDERLRANAICSLVRRYVRPLLGDRQMLRILDIGCGRGWLTKILTEFGSAVGMDPVSAAVDRGRKLDPSLDLRVGGLETAKLNFGDEAFDLIISSEVIEHVTATEKNDFVRRMFLLNRRDGWAIITTPRGELFDYCRRRGGADQPVEEWLTERALRQLIKSVGYQVVAHDRVFVPGYPYNSVARYLDSRALRVLHERVPCSVLSRVRDWFGIYQIALIRRPP